MSERPPNPGADGKTEIEEAPAQRGAFNSDEARYEGAEDEGPDAVLNTPQDEEAPDQEVDQRIAAYEGGYGGQEYGVEAGGGSDDA